MRAFDSLKVMYHGQPVGRLTMGTDDTCLFQYEREWLNDKDFIEAGTSIRISKKRWTDIIDEVKPTGQKLVERL